MIHQTIKRIRRASFTVEAAYIIPLMLVWIASLLGFTYYTHQKNWSLGAAYESIYFAVQKDGNKEAPEDRIKERLTLRTGERPLDLSEISSDAEKNAVKLKTEMKSTILPELFGDLFTMEIRASAADIDAAAFKKTRWIMKYASDTIGP